MTPSLHILKGYGHDESFFWCVFFDVTIWKMLWKTSPPPINACKSIPNLERLDLAICSELSWFGRSHSCFWVYLQRTNLRSVMARCATEHHGIDSRKHWLRILLGVYSSRAVSRKRRQSHYYLTKLTNVQCDRGAWRHG